ncbi:hypothetical protein EV426DRAFT_708215 [Tirmania nivea]|nr:hypothetical protein EV426DRAFT_708215 [Tirmania nivea]
MDVKIHSQTDPVHQHMRDLWEKMRGTICAALRDNPSIGEFAIQFDVFDDEHGNSQEGLYLVCSGDICQAREIVGSYLGDVPLINTVENTPEVELGAISDDSLLLVKWEAVENDVAKALLDAESVGEFVVGPVSRLHDDAIYLGCTGDATRAEEIIQSFFTKPIPIILDNIQLWIGATPPHHSLSQSSDHDTPLNTGFQEFPAAGSSIGVSGMSQSGSLGLAVSNLDHSKMFSITASHVMEHSVETDLPSAPRIGALIMSPPDADHNHELFNAIQIKIAMHDIFYSRYYRYMENNAQASQERRKLKKQVLQAERTVTEIKARIRQYGTTFAGFRGVVDGSIINIGVISPNPERTSRENYIDLAKPNTIVEFNGWQQPTKGMDVLKKGRSTNITYGKVLGKLHLNARISIGERILETSEWVIISGSNRPFMRAGDSGSAVCRCPEDGQTAVGVVGIMFGGSVGSQANLTFFMPAATVANGLLHLTGEYLQPQSYVPNNPPPRLLFTPHPLNHLDPPITFSPRPPTHEPERMVPPIEPPNMNWDIPMLDMYKDC